MGNKKRFKFISLAMTFFMIAVTVMGNIGVAFAEDTSNVKGTVNDPYTIAEALNYVQTTFATSNANGEVTVEGFIVGIWQGTANGLILADDASADAGSKDNTKLLYVIPHAATAQNVEALGAWNTEDKIGKKVKVTGNWRAKASAKYGTEAISTIGTVSGKDITITEAGSTQPEPVVLTGLSLPATAEVEANKTTKLTATFEPTNTTETEVEWTTGDDAIATVGQDGTVTGKAVGETTITVTSKAHSDIKAECNVTVKEAVPVTLMTIAEARAKAPGETVKVQGTVSRISGNNIFIQDAEAGMLVYKAGLNLTEGDLVEVVGAIKDYNGLIELVDGTDVVVSASVLSSGNAIAPKVVKINEVNENLESQLIKIEKATIGEITTTNTELTDSTGKINIYKVPALSDIKKDDTVDVTCLVGEYKGTYQLTVAKAEDVVKADLGPDTTAPVIDHTPLTEQNINLDLSVNAKVTDDRKIESVKLYYRTKGTAEFKSVDMVYASILDKYTATVAKADLDLLGFEYYIEASDGTNETTTETYDVSVLDLDITGPTITKVEPAVGAILDKANTKPGVRVEFNDESNIDITSVKLTVDSVDVIASATVKEDSVSYAMDKDLSEGRHTVAVEVSDTLGNKTTKSWDFTIGQLEYNAYFGELHSHTNISDGTGSLEDAYSWAKNNANADFFAVTDHSNWFDNDTQGSFFNADGTENDSAASTEWAKMHQVADQYNQDGEFVAIAGFEMTWSGSTGGWGHINTFNTKGFETRSHSAMDLQTYYGEVSKLPSSISQLNHPGKTFGDFADFGYYSKAADEVVNLIEVGNGEGAVRGSGYFPSYEYYTRALDKGWHVAPTNNEDNHKGNWVNGNTARTVVLAPTLTRESIYEAMREKRVYSTEDENLEIMYKVNNKIMGSYLDNPESLNIVIDLKDADASDKIGKVSIIANGGTVVESKEFDTNIAHWELQIDPNYDYYYVRVDEADKDIAVTAPVWTGDVTPVGISKVDVSQNPQVVNTPVDVTASVYNNGSTALSNVMVEFYKNEITPANKIGAYVIESIANASSHDAKITWTPSETGTIKLIAQTTIAINGKDMIFKESTTIDVENAEDLIKVVIDGGHQNQYVSGDYPGKMENLKALLKEDKIMLVQNQDELTAEDLENARILMITDPQSKDSSSKGLTRSKFTDAEIAVIKAFVDKGGSLIITSRADYDDKGAEHEYESSVQGNSILEAIGSNLRFNDDELVDNVNNGGQAYRLYFDQYTSSKYKLTTNVPSGQTYSAYSGTSVVLKENGNDEAVDWLVKGHDTTETLDSDLQNDNIPVAKGNVYSLAAEELASGGKIVVSGTTFFSDFETATGDNEYSNRLITENIIKWMTIPERSVAEVRIDADKDGHPDLLGKKFTIEGTVTAQSEAVAPKNSFFEVIYIQDATGGITVFGVSATPLKVGQKVRVTGFVDEYQGDTELQIVNEAKDLLIIDEAINIVEPMLISAKDSMLEENEGLLVKVQGTVTRMEEGNLYINDGTGEARVYVEGYIGDGSGNTNNNGKWDPSINVGDFVSAVGLASEDPEGHRLRVRNTTEIVKMNQSQAIKIEKISPETEFKAGQDAKVVMRATNNSAEGKDVTLIIALYDANNKLINYVAAYQNIAAGKTVDLSGRMRVLADGKFVKCFVWDTLEGMNPLSNVITLPVK